jgi:hypothetical protein
MADPMLLHVAIVETLTPGGEMEVHAGAPGKLRTERYTRGMLALVSPTPRDKSERVARARALLRRSA